MVCWRTIPCFLILLTLLAGGGDLSWGQLPFGQNSTFNAPPLQLYAEFDGPISPSNPNVNLLVHIGIAEGWHIYSIKPNDQYGPLPTTLHWENPSFKALRPLQESSPVIKQDKVLEMKLALHTHQMTLIQSLQYQAPQQKGEYELRGSVRYQICDNDICAPPQKQNFVALYEIKE